MIEPRYAAIVTKEISTRTGEVRKVNSRVYVFRSFTGSDEFWTLQEGKNGACLIHDVHRSALDIRQIAWT